MGIEPMTSSLPRMRATACATSAFCGASGRNRTNDTRIFSPLLYQLSYRGKLTMRLKEIWRRHPESNRGIKVLQTLALPLGDGAVPNAPMGWSGLRGSNPPPRPWQGRALPNELNPHNLNRRQNHRRFAKEFWRSGWDSNPRPLA